MPDLMILFSNTTQGLHKGVTLCLSKTSLKYSSCFGETQ